MTRTSNTWACFRYYGAGHWTACWHHTSEEAHRAAQAAVLNESCLYAYAVKMERRFSNFEAIARAGAPDGL